MKKGIIEEDKLKLLAEILNTIFEDDEGGIEHVDMSFKEFIKKLKLLATTY